jgi:beta-glucosidase-like glycosyl hydrolase/CubicO group peptidase (beta-lactamase class C family)
MNMKVLTFVKRDHVMRWIFNRQYKLNIMKYLILLCLFAGIFHTAETASGQVNSNYWVDSVYKSLSIEQRIAQLCIIRAYSWKDSTYNDSLTRVIQKYNVGGVCFFKGSPVMQAILSNRLQQSAQTPMLISMDAEWGLGMRLDSAFSFPRQMALGAITDDSLIYAMGRMVAKSCQRLGIQINFAPVVDINNNPKNPVISFRSFGENRDLVTRKSLLYMKGMQDGGIMTTAKHFPGHGDTDNDSHLTLPIINHSRQRMDSVELYPFKALINAGEMGVMIGHLYVPSLDSMKNTPATLSKSVITDLLKKQLGFNGYVFTDALDMQGVTKYYKPGEIELKALQAGNDILLLPQDMDMAIRGIKTAIDNGLFSNDTLERRCRRILELKEKLGLMHKPVIRLENLVTDLNPPASNVLRQKMVNESVTIIKNDLMMIPLTGLDRRKMAVLSMGDSLPNLFQTTLKKYVNMQVFNLPKIFTKQHSDSILAQISTRDIVILGIHGITSNAADTFGLRHSTIRFIDALTRTNRTIMALFGTPYALSQIPGIAKAEAIVVAYQDNSSTELAMAEVIFGGIGAHGKLPVTAGQFTYATGDVTEKSRLEFVIPEEIGLPSESLEIIDSLAQQGIASGAYPGCQILLAKNGKIFYEKSFGHPRYEDTVAVTRQDLYDLASVTKVAATTLAVMKLYDQGNIKLNDSLGTLLPVLKGSNKANLRIRDVMTHQAGLQDWIPFFKATLQNGNPDPAIYQADSSKAFPVRVAQNLYIRKDYKDTLIKRIIDSPLRQNSDYKYSDIGFYLLRMVVERISGLPFDRYLEATFYKPLGLTTLGFSPRNRFPMSQIIPTEYEPLFRKQLIWGDVHDPGAAMLGGMSGHAGLFSNASDVAVILQMLLQQGSYGGKEYVSSSTILEFTRVQFPEKGNRRGLGFDKPLLIFSPDGPSCKGTSPQSYGHSGFTGTYIWADPVNELIYIFLSNRVYPDAANHRLSEMNIRTNIHQAVYDLLEQYRIK